MTSFLFSALLPFFVYAQSVDIKNVDAGDESTVVEIRKGQKNVAIQATTNPIWEVQDGTADVEGDTGTLLKEARNNWKKNCESWKKEFRQDNKDNKIISLNCGSPTCTGEAGSKICTSKATYKIKTRLD